MSTCPASPTEDDDDELSGASSSKRPNRARSGLPVDLTIALQAVQSAIEGLRCGPVFDWAVAPGVAS